MQHPTLRLVKGALLLTLLALGAAAAAAAGAPASHQGEQQQLEALSRTGRAPLWGQRLENPWEEQLGEEGAAAHASIARWLERFFATEPAEALSPPPPRLPVVQPRRKKLPPRQMSVYNESSTDLHQWARWNATQSCGEALAAAPMPRRRSNLLIAPVGSSFDASVWMTHPEHATYDIVALYYGASPNFTCPLCKAVIRGGGTKWYLLHAYVTSHPKQWAALAGQYDAVMVADDDLEFDTCTLNRNFEIFRSYSLLLAQPSLCPNQRRATYWTHLYQQPASVLRFVSFVEIMAPMFEMSFFKGVVLPTLHNAYTGWGLDFTWPFLLRYPRRRVAVIDAACMLHSAPQGSKRGAEGDLYAVPVPYDEREEESRRVAEYGYYPSRVEAMGLPFRNMETFGQVLQTHFSAEAAAAATAAMAAEGASPLPGLGPGGIGEDAERQLQEPMAAARLLAGAAGAAAGVMVVTAVLRRKGRKGRRGTGRSPKIAEASNA